MFFLNHLSVFVYHLDIIHCLTSIVGVYNCNVTVINDKSKGDDSSSSEFVCKWIFLISLTRNQTVDRSVLYFFRVYLAKINFSI